MRESLYSSEVHEGETADIWANEQYLNSLLREQRRLQASVEAAHVRKAASNNPVTGLLATMSVNARTRRYESHNAKIDAAHSLPFPDYRDE